MVNTQNSENQPQYRNDSNFKVGKELKKMVDVR
jgi:hypothetical protein